MIFIYKRDFETPTIRVGQNRIYTPYMTVYLMISLPEIPYIHRINMVLANPTYNHSIWCHIGWSYTAYGCSKTGFTPWPIRYGLHGSPNRQVSCQKIIVLSSIPASYGRHNLGACQNNSHLGPLIPPLKPYTRARTRTRTRTQSHAPSHTHTPKHTHKHTFTHAHTHIHTSTYTNMHSHTQTHTHTLHTPLQQAHVLYIYVCVRVCACVCVCVFVCMCVCVCVCAGFGAGFADWVPQ
jgi:hypothetical protein